MAVREGEGARVALLDADLRDVGEWHPDGRVDLLPATGWVKYSCGIFGLASCRSRRSNERDARTCLVVRWAGHGGIDASRRFCRTLGVGCRSCRSIGAVRRWLSGGS